MPGSVMAGTRSVPVRDVLVDLVGQRDHTPALAQVRDHLELGPREDLAVGLFGVLMMMARVRLVKALEFRLRRTTSPARAAHVPRHRAGQDRVGP
jgi:hypothetical protein